MKTTRRTFIRNTVTAGGIAAVSPLVSCSSTTAAGSINKNYSALDEALAAPVLKKELFPDPVIIDRLELLRDRNNFICRVRSKDGAEGLAVGHPFIAKQGYPMFHNSLQRLFIGKDARDLDQLIFDSVEVNVKSQGVPLCVQIANIEFAVLDMLGKIAGKPAGELIGDIHNPWINVYLGTRIGEMRRMDPEKSLELLAGDVEETNSKAVKLRAGRGDNLGVDNENAPGRSEKLVRMAREKFGDDMVLMIDGNGTYSLEGAYALVSCCRSIISISMRNRFPGELVQEQKQMADVLGYRWPAVKKNLACMPSAGLSPTMHSRSCNPDTFYFGGMIRSMKVARMAQAAGKQIVPHSSGGGLGYLYMLHLVSACPNAGEYHEFKMFETNDANGTLIPLESTGEPFQSREGRIKVPDGPGLGVMIDPDYVKTHKVFEGEPPV